MKNTALRSKFYLCHQKRGEDILAYANRLESIFKIYQKQCKNLHPHTLIVQFCFGLIDFAIRRKMSLWLRKTNRRYPSHIKFNTAVAIAMKLFEQQNPDMESLKSS